MKTLISLCTILMVLLVACNKDQFVQDEDVMLKKANVPVPMKADFCATPDMTSQMLLVPIPGLDPTDPKNYMPSRMFVSGNATHMGEIITEKSVCDVTEFTFYVDDQGHPFLSQVGTGIMTAANGDAYNITWWVKTSLPSWNYVGEVEIQDGTGRFKGATGTVTMIGKVDQIARTNCWIGDGYIVYPPKK
jgi:hypothetical protein